MIIFDCNGKAVVKNYHENLDGSSFFFFFFFLIYLIKKELFRWNELPNFCLRKGASFQNVICNNHSTFLWFLQGIVGNLSSGKSALVHRYLTGTYVQEESPEGKSLLNEVKVRTSFTYLTNKREDREKSKAQNNALWNILNNAACLLLPL